MQTIKHLEMGALKIFLSISDKLGVTVFICSLSYIGYANGKMALSLVTLLCAVAFFVYLCKYFRHKPFGNKVIDVFSTSRLQFSPNKRANSFVFSKFINASVKYSNLSCICPTCSSVFLSFFK